MFCLVLYGTALALDMVADAVRQPADRIVTLADQAGGVS